MTDTGSLSLRGDLRDGDPAEPDLAATADDPEAADDRPTSRGALLRRATLVGGGAAATAGLVAATLPRLAASAPSQKQDIRILNYVLRLEYLKAAFYEEAARADLTGELRQFARLLARHERQHVNFLRRRLGRNAADARTFDFGDATSDPDAFARAARRLEETAVAAYIGQGANLTRRQMVPFAQITSVEARHAAWIADFLGRHPAPLAADEAMTSSQVVAAIRETGFEVAS